MTRIAHPLLYGMNLTQEVGPPEAMRRFVAKETALLAAANAGRDVAIRAARMTVGDRRLLGVVLGGRLPRGVEVAGFGQRQVALVDGKDPDRVEKYLVEKQDHETSRQELAEQCERLRAHFGTVALGAQVVTSGTNILGRSGHIVTRQECVPSNRQPLETAVDIDWSTPTLRADMRKLRQGLESARAEGAAVVGVMNPNDLVVFSQPIESANDDPTAHELHIGLISSRLPHRAELARSRESWAGQNDLQVYDQRSAQVTGFINTHRW
jgi:hypothetical protein